MHPIQPHGIDPIIPSVLLTANKQINLYAPWTKLPECHPSVKVVPLPTRETLFVALDHVLQCLTCVSTRVSPHSAIVSPHLCINSKSPSLVGHLGLKLVQPSPLSLSLEICHSAAADQY